MEKIIKLSQSDLNKIINKIVTEQTSIFEAESDVSDMITNFNSTASRELRIKMMNVQKKLKELGYDLGKFGPNKDGIDGKYGNLTFNAIVDFQKKNKIKPTGWVGPITARKMGVEPMEKGTKRLVGKSDGKISGDNKTIKKTNSICVGLPKSSCAKISSSNSVTHGNAGTNGCAQFVTNNLKQYDNSYYTGDAWKSFSFIKGAGGKPKYNLFYDLPWESIFREISNSKINLNTCNVFYKKDKSDRLAKNSQEKKILEIINKYVPSRSGINVNILKPGDVVGLWHNGSPSKGRAFCERMVDDLKLDNNGKFKNLPFTFNTHVGYVTAIKDGVPIIAHNVDGTYYTVPATNLLSKGTSDMIVWVITDNDVKNGIALVHGQNSNQV